MKRTGPALIVVLAAGFTAACADRAAQQKAGALEQRIAELEKQSSPSPAALDDTLPPEQAVLVYRGSESTVHAAEPRRPAAPRPPAPRPVVQREPVYSAPAPARVPRPVVVEPAPPPAPEPPDGEVQPEPAPRWEPAPRPEPLTLPADTELTLILETPVSSQASQEGDPVVARVERAVADDGRVALPGGTILKGRVVEASPAGRVKGRARVAVSFDSITVRGRTHELQASLVTAEAPAETARDAKMAGGAAAAGTVIGAIAGGKKGAVKGAVIGGVVGGGAVLATKGREVEMPAGSRWKVRLQDRLLL